MAPLALESTGTGPEKSDFKSLISIFSDSPHLIWIESFTTDGTLLPIWSLAFVAATCL